MSVWASALAVAMFVLFPWANWPFAMAWLYLVQLDIRNKPIGRKMVVSIGEDGNWAFTSGLSAEETERIVWDVARALHLGKVNNVRLQA